jgi:hypothetical protein
VFSTHKDSLIMRPSNGGTSVGTAEDYNTRVQTMKREYTTVKLTQEKRRVEERTCSNGLTTRGLDDKEEAGQDDTEEQLTKEDVFVSQSRPAQTSRWKETSSTYTSHEVPDSHSDLQGRQGRDGTRQLSIRTRYRKDWCRRTVMAHIVKYSNGETLCLVSQTA